MIKEKNFFKWTILTTLGTLLISCSNSEELKVIKEEIISSCNILDDENCKEEYELTKNNPVKIIGNNHILVTTSTGCNTYLETQSIKKNEAKISIELVEKGAASLCGSELKTIDLEMSEAVSLEKLEISQYSEHLGEIKKIYPIE